MPEQTLFFKIAAAFILLALTVFINVAGLTWTMHRLNIAKIGADLRLWSSSWLLIRLAACVVAIHVVAISIWAGFYVWQGCLPDFHTSLYFSIITYTTVGYGDVVLTPDWRLLSGVEALTGILMCGLSTGYFFAVVHRFLSQQSQPAG
ncbi:MAG: potassium channel family protein [Chthoniobacterales bacterium]